MSILIPVSIKNAPMRGASLFPRLFNGRSKSAREGSFQLDFACRISNSCFIGTAPSFYLINSIDIKRLYIFFVFVSRDAVDSVA
jgi:hypothetical protein